MEPTDCFCYCLQDIMVWRVEHDLDYNVLCGGHDKAVIALYTCSGGVVR